MGRALESSLAILNGLVGQYLHAEENQLATRMMFVHDDRELSLDREALRAAFPRTTANAKLVVFVHGMMCTERVWRLPDGEDYGTLLARDLGFTPLYLRYNSGRSIADNGATFSARLTELVQNYPFAIDEIVLVGFSMGGLVIRSACEHAEAAHEPWLRRVHRAIYIGTPHLGAPLERAGKAVTKLLTKIEDPYLRLIVDIANLRSDGIKDLGHGDISHEDRALTDSGTRSSAPPRPLHANIHHHLIAGTLLSHPRLADLLGDTLVPVQSATFGHATENVHVVEGVTHTALAHDMRVYEQIRRWCEVSS